MATRKGWEEMAYLNFNARMSEIEDAIGSCKIYMKDLQDTGFYPEAVPRLEGAIAALELLTRLESLKTMGSAVASCFTWKGDE